MPKINPSEPVNRGMLEEAVEAILEGMDKTTGQLSNDMNTRFNKVEDRLGKVEDSLGNVEVELSHVKDEVRGLKSNRRYKHNRDVVFQLTGTFG